MKGTHMRRSSKYHSTDSISHEKFDPIQSSSKLDDRHHSTLRKCLVCTIREVHLGLTCRQRPLPLNAKPRGCLDSSAQQNKIESQKLLTR